jgi:outer membrane immunogenic protein
MQNLYHAALPGDRCRYSTVKGKALGLIGTPAFAADVAVKAPPAPAPAPVYNWTGWYVGVNAGASMGNVKTDLNVAPTIAIASITAFAGSNTVAPSGFIGGGQIGYNWQYSPLIVVGLEADIQGALERDSNILTNSFAGLLGPAPVTGTVVTNYTTNIDWFGTVRGRLGYVWGNNGDVLTYVTGGLAYGEVKINGTSTVSGALTGIAFTPITGSFGQSHVNTGWTLGYGTEGAIDFWGAHNWTWQIESLYMDLGHLNNTFGGGLIATNSHFTDWILRGGLNYRFY